MLAEFTFDYSAFYEKLLKASREGFRLFKERYAGEKFYCFALYAHPTYSFIYTTGNTEEGLTRRAQHCLEIPGWSAVSTLDETRISLRHNVGDFPSMLDDYALFEPIFAEIFKLTEARSNALFHIWSALSKEVGEDKAFDLVEPHEQQFLDTSFAVLKQLDIEGMFGTGEAREHVILNFLMGDQSADEIYTYAKGLNPPHLFKRYLEECEAGWAMDEMINLRRKGKMIF